MSIKLGSTSIGSLYLGSTKIGSAYLGSTKIYESSPSPVDPLNPLGLQPYTVRVKLAPGYTPSAQTGVTHTLVDATENIWDYYKNSSTFYRLFYQEGHLLEVLGANTTGVTTMTTMFFGCTSLTTVSLFDTSVVTSMAGLFNGCSSLTTVPLFDTSDVTYMNSMFNGCSSLAAVPLFDTSSVTYMDSMFYNCSSLTTVPLFDTSDVTDMSSMFYNCTSVASGALALYQQASTQTNPPTYYDGAFYNCGSNTQTGAAELAQIPSSWGGTGA